MTENDAKTKWCPMSQVSTDGTLLATNRGRTVGNGENPGLKCIATECMAWRWEYVLDYGSVPLGKNAHNTDSDGEWLGYCGLAGKP